MTLKIRLNKKSYDHLNCIIQWITYINQKINTITDST